MLLFSVIILAIIQGLTEFLPVSSSGHLILLPKILHLKNFGLAFDAFLHLGTLFAVVIYFRKDIVNLLKGFLQIDKQYSKISYAILFATMPVVLIGFTFKSFFASTFIHSVDCVAYTLILGAILIYIAEKFYQKNEDMQNLSIMQIFFIGLMQCLALFPGMSRSGTTIAAGIFMGLKKDEAARFSFLLGLPAIAGAGLLALKDMYEAQSLELDLVSLFLAFFVSFIAGFIAIDFLLKFLKQASLSVFVIYRILMAILLLLLF